MTPVSHSCQLPLDRWRRSRCPRLGLVRRRAPLDLVIRRPGPRRRAASATAPSPDPRVGLRAGLHGRRRGDLEPARALEDAAAGAVRRESPTPTWPSPATTPSRATTTATRSGTSRIRASPTLQDGVRLPGVAERRLGLPEPALRLRRGSRRPARLRDPGRRGHGQHRAAARHPHLRHQRHQQSAGTSATCRPAAARTPTRCWSIRRTGERLRLHLGLVRRCGRPASCRAA